MLNPQLLRNDLELVAEQLKTKRGFIIDVVNYSNLESQRKDLQTKAEAIQAQRNSLAKQIGQAKSKGESAEELLAQAVECSSGLSQALADLELVQQQLEQIQQSIPNIPIDLVPIGKDEHDNKVISSWGEIPKFDFPVRDHVDLGELHNNGIDFKTAAKVSGARFSFLSGAIAKLHRALAQFMLDKATAKGYKEYNVPLLVNSDSLFGTGQLPKFAEDLFHTQQVEGQNRSLSLISTSEIPLTNIVANEILELKKLPLRFCSHSTCFRSEAGSYGRDTRGLIRQHQFEKIELVHICTPEQSGQQLEELTSDAESILQDLGLAYRKILLCTGDMGFSSQMTYDLEVWVPAQNTYREISSCSNMGEFQARRMQARYRDSDGKVKLLHTLNGSGLAVGRTLVAVLENYQQADGSIKVPQVLQKYLGLEVISPED